MAAKRVYLPRTLVACLVVAAVLSSIRAQQPVLDENSCLNLNPRLLSAPQNNANAPFVVQVSSQSYFAGSTITVTYLPRLSSFLNFQEIIVQARRTTAGSTQAVGTFTSVDDQTIANNVNYRFYNCDIQGTLGSTVGTANAITKEFPLTLIYRAPNPSVGNIRFVATIVQQGQVYYQAFQSQDISDVTAVPPQLGTCQASAEVFPVDINRAVYRYTTPTCTSPNGDVTTVICSPPSLVVVPVSPQIVCTCRAGTSGLTDVCTITGSGGNTAPGPPDCPNNGVTVVSIGGSQTAVATYGSFVCSDAEQGSIVATCNPPSGSSFNIGGNNGVTCTCTDVGGLESSCRFFVNVVGGNTQPGPPNCPNNGVTVVAAGGSTTAAATYGLFFCSDAEQGSITATCNPISGSQFNIGQNNVVTCTCTDNGGLQSRCTFFVNVVGGNTQPGPPNCPNNGVTVVTVGGSTTAAAPYGPFFCSDAEQGSITANCNPISGSQFNIGQNNVVTCTCTDNGGLQSRCTFFVNVVEGNTPPGPPNCPINGITVVTVGGSTTAVATYGPFFCSDVEQGSITANCNPVSGSQFSIGGLNTVTCTCTDNGLLQSNCNFRVIVSCSDACSFNNRCVNGGTCRVYPGSCTQTFCDCPPCFTGADCQIAVSPCDVNRCQNGGFCVPNGQSCDSYTCLCTGCSTGPFCNEVFNPCSRSPCQNGGICTNIAETCASYSCECIGCFTGYNCQTPIPDPCLAAPCLNGGLCRREQGTCFGYTCQCLPGFGGVVCENNVVVLRNPCASFPCLNYGWCIPLRGNAFKCLCRSQYTGVQCADVTANVIGSNSCSTNRCSNGGTCFNSYSSNSGSIIFAPQYTCVCAPGFAGQSCNFRTAVNAQFDTCATGGVVCRNGGTCRNTFCSFSGDLGTYCACQIGFYGERCQIVDVNPCESNPCRNDGRCTPFKNYFDCQCPATFSGPTCEVVGQFGACISSPCLNGGTCFDVTNGFVCVCTSFFTGSICATLIQDTCNTSPCLNGGTCIEVINGFVCVCTPFFTGSTCATFIQQVACNSNPCLNGGTCIDVNNGFLCVCTPSFTGSTCATFIQRDACISNPCLNGGSCFEVTNGFVCQCLAPFTGFNCENEISACTSRPCLNGGTCIDVPGGFLCLCTSLYEGSFCESTRALTYNPGEPLLITSPEFPSAYTPGETQSVVVTSTANLRVFLRFFEVSNSEQLSIGWGDVIGRFSLQEYRNDRIDCTPDVDCVTVINGNTFWIQFVSNARTVETGQGFVLAVTQG